MTASTPFERYASYAKVLAEKLRGQAGNGAVVFLAGRTPKQVREQMLATGKYAQYSNPESKRYPYLRNAVLDILVLIDDSTYAVTSLTVVGPEYFDQAESAKWKDG